MKILVASDLHGELGRIRELVKKAKEENVDAILIAGDLTHLETKLEGIVGELKKSGKRIILIPGNEETNPTIDFLVNLYRPMIYNVHKSYFILGNVGIIGVGGATKVGPNFLSEEEIFESLRENFEKIKDKKVKIVLVHEPPEIPELTLGFEANKKLVEFIKKYQPDILICGHMHETFGKKVKVGKTLVINPGPKGEIIEIED